MKIKSYSKVLSALAISSLLLAACSDDTEKSSTKEKKGKDVEQVDASKFPTKTTNQGEPIEGGHLTYGLVSNTPFEGILNKVFYQGEPDHQIITFLMMKIYWIQMKTMYIRMKVPLPMSFQTIIKRLHLRLRIM